MINPSVGDNASDASVPSSEFYGHMLDCSIQITYPETSNTKPCTASEDFDTGKSHFAWWESFSFGSAILHLTCLCALILQTCLEFT